MAERYPPRRVDQLHQSWVTDRSAGRGPAEGAATGGAGRVGRAGLGSCHWPTAPRAARAMTREAREDSGIDDAAGDAAALIASEPALSTVAACVRLPLGH